MVAGPSMQLLGSTWARAFATKGETGPDLHHGKSELQAKQRGGGWAAAVIGWEGVDEEEAPPAVGFLGTRGLLPGEFHGQRSLKGYSPWGHKE